MLNRKTIRLLVTAILAFILIGCASKAPEQVKPLPPKSAPQTCIPDWVKNPPQAEDGLYGSGQARMENPALGQDMSDTRARAALAVSLKTRVEVMIKTFMQQAGMANEAESLEFAQSVGRVITQQDLTGSRIIKRDICPDGTYHSLAFMPFSAMGPTVDNTAKTLQKKSEEAAKYSFEELRTELDRLLREVQ
ncbi:MAG: hypothetical protein AB7E47_12580 [Desulfovibrionaceae bacterium]